MFLEFKFIPQVVELTHYPVDHFPFIIIIKMVSVSNEIGTETV